jgi:SAM-dependent methyltransferase
MRSEAYARSAAVEREHWWFRARAAIVDRVLARFLSRGGLDVLDVGCGTGSDFTFLSRWGRVVGVDAHESAVAACRAAGFDARRAEATELAFGDDAFDLVCCLDVLNGVEAHGDAMAEAARVAKPGALLLFTVGALPSLWGATDDLSLHVRRYTRDELLAIVPPSCEVLHCTYFNTLLFPLAWISRRLERRSAAPTDAVPGVALPVPVAALLRFAFGLERHLVPWLRLPIGVSLLLVLRRRRASCAKLA